MKESSGQKINGRFVATKGYFSGGTLKIEINDRDHIIKDTLETVDRRRVGDLRPDSGLKFQHISRLRDKSCRYIPCRTRS